MPSSDFRPETDHRDIGLGVTFFRHPYRSSEDRCLYYHHTHVPVLGYCPGCSPQADENLRSTSSSNTAAYSTLLDSIFPASTTDALAEFTECDVMYDYPEDGVLVNAETFHAGPSYTRDGQEVSEHEERRIELVQFMLDRWARAEEARNRRKCEESMKRIETEQRQRQIWGNDWFNGQEKSKGNVSLNAVYNPGFTNRASMKENRSFQPGMISAEKKEVYTHVRGRDVDMKDTLTRHASTPGTQQRYMAPTTKPNPTSGMNKNDSDEDVEITGSRKLAAGDRAATAPKFGSNKSNYLSARGTYTTKTKTRKERRDADLGLMGYRCGDDEGYDDNAYDGGNVEMIEISDED